MADFTKTPLGRSLNTVAIQRAADAISALGRNLPCVVTEVVGSGIVTVSFQVNASPTQLSNVTIPIEYPEYIRYPIQVGDKGMTISADVRIGAITGLGAGIPNMSRPANLAALSFVWLGNSGWSATDDPQALVLYGPNGVILRDSSGASKMTLTPSGVTVASETINLNGTVVINGQPFLAHQHSGIQTGPDDSGGVV